MPEDVRDTFGNALLQAQCSGKSSRAKPLVGFVGTGVLEIVADDLTDT
jgi:phage-related protein